MSPAELDRLEHQARHTSSSWAEWAVLALVAEVRTLQALLEGTPEDGTTTGASTTPTPVEA